MDKAQVEAGAAVRARVAAVQQPAQGQRAERLGLEQVEQVERSPQAQESVRARFLEVRPQALALRDA